MSEPLNGWHVTRRGFHFLYRDDLCLAELSRPADSDGAVRRWTVTVHNNPRPDKVDTYTYTGSWQKARRMAEADAKYGRGK